MAVQAYGRPNLEMNAPLARLGAQLTPIANIDGSFRTIASLCVKPPADSRLGQVTSSYFTLSIQLNHLIEIGRELGIETQVRGASR
jgi:hypothetical protein